MDVHRKSHIRHLHIQVVKHYKINIFHFMEAPFSILDILGYKFYMKQRQHISRDLVTTCQADFPVCFIHSLVKILHTGTNQSSHDEGK